MLDRKHIQAFILHHDLWPWMTLKVKIKVTKKIKKIEG